MSLQLIGINRCPSCNGKNLVWECPVCHAAVEADQSSEVTEGVGLRGVKCATCGEDREVVAYEVPEALTDFWVHDIRVAERISRVDFSEDRKRPVELHMRGRRIMVEQLLFFLRVQDEEAPGTVPRGAYFLRTEFGVCVVVATAHELPDGEILPGLTDWFMIEMDDAMHRELAGHLVSGRVEGARGYTSLDEGLLRNSCAYGVVFRIENSLRSLVARRLCEKAQGSSKWWKAVVPNTLQEQVLEVESRRRQSAWFELPTDEPIYFTTLGQLRDLLAADWSTLGKDLGPKEVLLGAIRKVEFYRNELAHCRPLTLRMLSDLHEIERSLTRAMVREA